MPLRRSPSDKARSENVREMIDSGHDPAQAVAAAYSNQRREQNRHHKTAHTKSSNRIAARFKRGAT